MLSWFANAMVTAREGVQSATCDYTSNEDGDTLGACGAVNAVFYGSYCPKCGRRHRALTRAEQQTGVESR